MITVAFLAIAARVGVSLDTLMEMYAADVMRRLAVA